MIRVFPKRNKWTPDDPLAFIGDPLLFRPPEQAVKVSVTFSWDIAEGLRLQKAWADYYSDVQIGGPAFDDPGGDFTPQMFLKKGVTITSRGCIRNCSWCFVPKREGKIRELSIMDGHIVQDNNLLACSREHIEGVFDMLQKQNKAVTFSGGIDARLLKQWHIDLVKSIKLHELWFACDSLTHLKILEKTADLLSDFSTNKKRCYVMIGFDGENIIDAERRLEKVYKLGFLPFCQLYRDDGQLTYSDDWKKLNRKWSRPVIYRSTT